MEKLYTTMKIGPRKRMMTDAQLAKRYTIQITFFRNRVFKIVLVIL